MSKWYERRFNEVDLETYVCSKHRNTGVLSLVSFTQFIKKSSLKRDAWKIEKPNWSFKFPHPSGWKFCSKLQNFALYYRLSLYRGHI